MNILITQLELKANSTHIIFSCRHGKGKGVWQGENAEVGSTPYVEFEIEELLKIEKNTMIDKRYSIQLEDEVTSFTGDILSIQDEILFFRFAETIIQLDCIFSAIEIGDWVTISTKAENLLLYPVNL